MLLIGNDIQSMIYILNISCFQIGEELLEYYIDTALSYLKLFKKKPSLQQFTVPATVNKVRAHSHQTCY